MARKIQSRLKITATLIAQSPIHIGGINNNPHVDLALATNGQGQYYIPGTSIAGGFRGWMQSFADEKILQTLWGYEKNTEGHASFILVEDAPIQGAVAEIRDGVGINRISGTAAEQVKYDRAILPKGTKIPLDITLEISSEIQFDRPKKLFTQLLKALQNGEIRLGAAKTRGLGRVKLENLSIREHQLNNRDGILKMLQGQSKSLKLDNLPSGDDDLAQIPQINIEIHWRPENSVMVKSEGDGIAVDILPLVSRFDKHFSFVLPGSSIKGALRTQAERIIRTVYFLPTRESFMEQIEVPLIEDLFGVRAKADNKRKKGIGSLFIDDCYANVNISPNDWGNIQAAKSNSDLRKTLDNAKLQTTQQAFHVAVDRWTGGAADGFLYSNLEPMGVNWQPIRLQFNLTRFKESKLAAIALIFFILRDLAHNRIPLGYGTNRGMGTIKVANIIINSRNLDDSLKSLENITLIDGNISLLNQDMLSILNQAWTEWIRLTLEDKK